MIPAGNDNNESDSSDESQGDVIVEERRPEQGNPPRYAVVLHNDDFTTMEFVMEVLERFFNKTVEQARALMLQVHQQGRGVAGIYSFEIAETKVAQVQGYARQKGHPLKCTMEAVDS